MFTTCQRGAEPVLKRELAREWPLLRFAYSRPGFLTFRLPANHRLRDDFDLRSVFARAYGFSLGKVVVDDPAAAVAEAWRLAGDLPIERLHVWQRDLATPGQRGYEPGMTPAALAAREAILAARPAVGSKRFKPEPTARGGQLALDCVLVEENEWWVGYHRAHDVPSCQPGGLFEIKLPSDAVSRAYLKMEEALLWSRLPIGEGQRVAEIGSAPGGASQALLNHGLQVIGVDPAEMAPAVLDHPRFTHIRKRGHEARRREFRKARWLVADMNVAPSYTLDTVESIVTHPEVDLRGMLLTLKLLEWELADELPEQLERVRSWGYDDVRARQLQHNRQEVCLAALRGGRRR